MFEIDLEYIRNMISRDRAIQAIQLLRNFMKALHTKIILMKL